MLFLGTPEYLVISFIFLLLGVAMSFCRLHLPRRERILPSLIGAGLFSAAPTLVIILTIIFDPIFILTHLIESLRCFLSLLLVCGLPYVLGNLIRHQKPAPT